MSKLLQKFESAKHFIIELIGNSGNEQKFRKCNHDQLAQIVMNHDCLKQLVIDLPPFQEYLESHLKFDDIVSTLKLDSIIEILNTEFNKLNESEKDPTEEKEEVSEEASANKEEVKAPDDQEDTDDGEDDESKEADKFQKFLEQFSFKTKIDKQTKEFIENEPILKSTKDRYLESKAYVLMKWKAFVSKVNQLSDILGIPLLVIALTKSMESNPYIDVSVRIVGTIAVYLLMAFVFAMTVLRYYHNPTKGLKKVRKQFKVKMPNEDEDEEYN